MHIEDKRKSVEPQAPSFQIVPTIFFFLFVAKSHGRRHQIRDLNAVCEFLNLCLTLVYLPLDSTGGQENIL
jgi:hypothetical protein